MTSRKKLEALCVALNEKLGRPTTYLNASGKGCSVGHICLYKSHFGYELHEVANDGGAVRNFGYDGCMSAREMLVLLRGIMFGINALPR